jgi:protein gp37
MRMASRLEAMGQSKYTGTTRKSGGRAKWNGKIVLDEAALSIPQKWKSPKIIFVNSMSDLFHEKIPVEFIAKVFEVMRGARRHTFQVLTKRAERLAQVAADLPWPDNVWMGVSVESKDYVDRIDHLRSTQAYIKFLSLEPLLGPLDHLDLRGVDWTIAGGESGPAARPMDPEWVRSIRDQCVNAGVAFHFKQWGGVQKKQTGRLAPSRKDPIPQRFARSRDLDDDQATQVVGDRGNVGTRSVGDHITTDA